MDTRERRKKLALRRESEGREQEQVRQRERKDRNANWFLGFLIYLYETFKIMNVCLKFFSIIGS